MFPFPIMPPGGLPLVTCDAADFDGTNDYATRGAGLTGAADSKKLTFVTWLNSTATGAEQRILVSADPLGGINSVVNIQKNATNKLVVLGENAAASQILHISSAINIPSGWTCVLCSVDMADTGKRHIYFGDTSSLSATIYTDDTLDITSPDWIVGARGDGALKFTGGMAELMLWPGVYIDFSQTANRRKFVSSSGKPVDPSATGGAIATLGAPAIYFHLNDAETANNFVANDDGGATGGAFTVTGALTTYASSPSD